MKSGWRVRGGGGLRPLERVITHRFADADPWSKMKAGQRRVWFFFAAGSGVTACDGTFTALEPPSGA
jgi:hypothetical protein